MLGLLLDFLFDFVRRWIRRTRIARFARFHGWSIRPEQSGSDLPFPANIFSRDPSKAYRLSRAANVIRGSLHGLEFTYFEKTLIVDSGFSVGQAAGTRSIVAIYGSASESFESDMAFNKQLVFYRENGSLYFVWNSTGHTPEAIPIKQLNRWLADITGAFKTGVHATVLAVSE